MTPYSPLAMQADFTWITDRVAVGNRGAAHDAQLRAREGFISLVSLDGSMNWKKAEILGYEDLHALSLVDGHGNSVDAAAEALRALVQMIDDGPPVLVHCHAGGSRSVSLVAAWLAWTQSITLSAGYAQIANKRETAVQDGLPQLMQKVLGRMG